jgi:hypothetical protein
MNTKILTLILANLDFDLAIFGTQPIIGIEKF